MSNASATVTVSRAGFIENLVEFLNSDRPYMPGHTTRQVNELSTDLVASGEIVELPGSPYCWAVAS